MYSEHHDGGLIEIESLDVDFLDDDFSSVGEIKQSLELYELGEHQDGVS